MIFPNFLRCGPKAVTNTDPLPALDTTELESSWKNTPVDHHVKDVKATSSGTFTPSEQKSSPDDSCRKRKASKEDEDRALVDTYVPRPWSPSGRRSVDAFLHEIKLPNPSSSGNQRAREKHRPWLRVSCSSCCLRKHESCMTTLSICSGGLVSTRVPPAVAESAAVVHAQAVACNFESNEIFCSLVPKDFTARTASFV